MGHAGHAPKVHNVGAYTCTCTGNGGSSAWCPVNTCHRTCPLYFQQAIQPAPSRPRLSHSLSILKGASPKVSCLKPMRFRGSFWLRSTSAQIASTSSYSTQGHIHSRALGFKGGVCTRHISTATTAGSTEDNGGRWRTVEDKLQRTPTQRPCSPSRVLYACSGHQLTPKHPCSCPGCCAEGVHGLLSPDRTLTFLHTALSTKGHTSISMALTHCKAVQHRSRSAMSATC